MQQNKQTNKQTHPVSSTPSEARGSNNPPPPPPPPILQKKTTSVGGQSCLFPCLLVSSADNLCRQSGPRSFPKEHRTWSASKLFDTLGVFLKDFFKNVDFEKSQQMTKKHEKFTRIEGRQGVNSAVSAFRSVTSVKDRIIIIPSALTLFLLFMTIVVWSLICLGQKKNNLCLG